MTRIGILGVGHLAEFLMRGAAGSGFSFLLSPRSPERAARLGAEFGATVAADNQAVVDGADLVLVCLPAADGLGLLRGLRFRAGQSVLSCMAGTRIAPLAEAVAPARAACAMMPGLANAYGMGPSLIHPDAPDWLPFLSACGPVHAVADEAAFTAATSFGALSGASFFLMDRLIRWFTAQGLEEGAARQLVAETLRGNAEVLLRDPAPLSVIRRGIATPGGITEMLVSRLERDGGLSAWDHGMDDVLRRVRG